MRGAGLNISQIHAGGVSISDLRSAGLTLLQLYNGGISTAQLRSGGATVAEMRMEGLSIFQMYVGGVSTAQMKEAGITIAQMRNAGLTLSQIHAGGVSISDLLSAGFSVADLRSGGISIAELSSGGVSIADLRRAGGIADHLVFNEACNTPDSGDPEFTSVTEGPVITSVSLELDTDDNTYAVVLEGKATDSIRWQSSVIIRTSGRNTIRMVRMLDSPGDITTTVGDVTSLYVRNEGTTVVARLSIPLDDVFSNPTVEVGDTDATVTSIDLCPGS